MFRKKRGFKKSFKFKKRGPFRKMKRASLYSRRGGISL